MTNNRNLTRSRSTSNTAVTHWFFLDGESQQGPFSVDELRGYFEIGAVAQQTLLWHSGMSEWLPVEQVAEFAKYAGSLPSVPTPLAIDWSSEKAISDGFSEPVKSTREPQATKPAPVPEAASTPTYESVLRYASGGHLEEPRLPNLLNEIDPQQTPHSDQLLTPHLSKWKSFTDRQIPPQNYVAFEKPGATGLNRKALMAIGGFGGIFLLVAGITAVRQGSEPAVFSKISRESQAELKSALHSSLKLDGPKVAVGLSTTDIYAPFFVVGTNLPNGQTLEVSIDGVPETLVDRFKVSVHTTTTVKDGVALTPVFRQEQGIPYPSGSYRVRVSCPQCETLAESANSPLADKVFAVNTKSLNYEENLSAYHVKLRSQAKDELTEIKQVTETLESQLNETDSAFQQLANRLKVRKTIKAARREWTEFDEHWTTLQRQLETLFARWTPTALDGGYYYATLYTTLKKAGDATSILHDEQNKFMMEEVLLESKPADTFLARAQKIRASLEALRTKIRSSEGSTGETLPNAAGMPPTLD